MCVRMYVLCWLIICCGANKEITLCRLLIHIFTLCLKFSSKKAVNCYSKSGLFGEVPSYMSRASSIRNAMRTAFLIDICKRVCLEHWVVHIPQAHHQSHLCTSVLRWSLNRSGWLWLMTGALSSFVETWFGAKTVKYIQRGTAKRPIG